MIQSPKENVNDSWDRDGPMGNSIPSSTNVSNLRLIQTFFSLAALLATLFTAFSPDIFSLDLRSRLRLLTTPEAPGMSAVIATATPKPRVGLVAGHWGHDSGAVCPNGTTEVQVNLAIATLAQQKLAEQGYSVDVLQEFDPRLQGYKAALLLSIHNDSCEYINDQATGYKVAASQGSRDPNRTTRLVACLTDRYGRITGLSFHSGSVTVDMTEYHAFDEVDASTPAAIIETGFLRLDYDFLTRHTDRVADGVVAGILCFLNNESVAPTPLTTP